MKKGKNVRKKGVPTKEIANSTQSGEVLCCAGR